jgi:hypothetical protein
MNPLAAWRCRRRHRAAQRSEVPPTARIIPALLDQAHAAGASAVVFGFRPDLPLAEQLPEPLSDDHPEIRLVGTHAASIPLDAHAAQQRSVTWRGPNHSTDLPIWFLKNDTFHLHQYLPLQLFPHVLNSIESALVSLNGTETDPQPCRYLELPSTAPRRRFAEIDLEWSAANLLHIHLRALKELALATRTSKALY